MCCCWAGGKKRSLGSREDNNRSLRPLGESALIAEQASRLATDVLCGFSPEFWREVLDEVRAAVHVGANLLYLSSCDWDRFSGSVECIQGAVKMAGEVSLEAPPDLA